MVLMEKPPSPRDLEERVLEKFGENSEYRESDSLLVLDILQEEAQYRFSKDLDDLEPVEKMELTAPGSITRKRRELHGKRQEYRSMELDSAKSRILWKVQEDNRYANSDTLLTIDMWVEEARERFDHEGKLKDLSWSEKQELSQPESFSRRRRELQEDGFISADGEVQEGRVRKAERFREYYRRMD